MYRLVRFIRVIFREYNYRERYKIKLFFVIFFLQNSPDTQQGNCFTRLSSNQDCADPLPMKLSKKDCCCGKDMGKGWGNTCEHCPSQGVGKYPIEFPFNE